MNHDVTNSYLHPVSPPITQTTHDLRFLQARLSIGLSSHIPALSAAGASCCLEASPVAGPVFGIVCMGKHRIMFHAFQYRPTPKSSVFRFVTTSLSTNGVTLIGAVLLLPCLHRGPRLTGGMTTS